MTMTLAQAAAAVPMAWYIPILLFFARICDVSISTVRTILMLSGMKVVPAMLGAVEVTIWVLAVGGVIMYLPGNPVALVAYACGFAAGVLVGTAIEDRLALGFRVVRVISPHTGGGGGDEAGDGAGAAGGGLSARLRALGYPVTRVDASGRSGPVEMAFMVIRRRDLRGLREHIEEIAPDSFVSIERAERPSGGVFRAGARSGGLRGVLPMIGK
jgi:uncharacterized protein YebE (UPF0316 family)